MVSKSLIGVAIASTFGWAAAAYAGPDHQTSSISGMEAQQSPTVMYDAHPAQSPTMDWTVTHSELGGSPLSADEGVGSSSLSGGGTVGGSFPSAGIDPAPRFDSAGNEVSAIDRASQGIYSEYYLVSLNPATASDWESYVIAMEPAQSEMLVMLDDGASDTLVILDDGAYMASTYDVILLPSDVVYFAPNSGTSIE
jgi:hypothetical protein